MVVAGALGGCVDSFRGSNVQVDLPPTMLVQAPVGLPPTGDQIPYAAHFRLYGIQKAEDRDSLFELQRFEIHKIVDPTSPCFIDVGTHVRFPGLHVSQFGAMVALDTGIPDVTMPPADATTTQKIDAATAVQRMMNIAALSGNAGMKAITSASELEYPDVAADCTSTDGIPPPTCTDDAANARRLEACQDAWKRDSDFWEGTDRILTSPLAGTTFGMVDGQNPVNLAPVGGAQWFVDEDLSEMDAFALYWQMDGVDDPGNLLMYGEPHPATRGTLHVELVAPGNPLFNADLVIFENLDEDNVRF